MAGQAGHQKRKLPKGNGGIRCCSVQVDDVHLSRQLGFHRSCKGGLADALGADDNHAMKVVVTEAGYNGRLEVLPDQRRPLTTL
jgi:hypothetical protein